MRALPLCAFSASASCQFPPMFYSFLQAARYKQQDEEAFKNIPQSVRVSRGTFKCVCVCAFLMMPADCKFLVSMQVLFASAGYDVQSASTPDGVLYITGAPRYNHTGRVVIYRLNKKNKIVVSQILKGEQVSLSASTVPTVPYCHIVIF